MDRCSCYSLLLKHLHVRDLVIIVQEYVHRSDPRCVFPADVRANNVSIEADIELKFVIYMTNSGKHKRYLNNAKLPLELTNHQFNAYDFLSPANWDRLSIKLWPNERSRIHYMRKFAAVIKKLRIELRDYFEQDAHWLIDRPSPMIPFALSYDILRVMDGMGSLSYS